MFSILMTSLTDTPLILQWEVWFTSLLGLKGLNHPFLIDPVKNNFIKESNVLCTDHQTKKELDFSCGVGNVIHVTGHHVLDKQIDALLVYASSVSFFKA